MMDDDTWTAGPEWLDAWIVGQSIDGERDYVVHLERPRCVIECVEGADGGIDAGSMEFIDPVGPDEVERLVREALDVFDQWERALEDEEEE